MVKQCRTIETSPGVMEHRLMSDDEWEQWQKEHECSSTLDEIDNYVSNDVISIGEFDAIPDRSVTFSVGAEAVLVLDENGMTYKGELIEDAGEAHRVFLEVLYGMRAERGEQCP